MGQLLALDGGNGSTKWSFDSGMAVGYARAMGNIVFASVSNDCVFALDKGSGGLLWAHTGTKEVYDSPRVRRHGLL